LQFAEPIRVVMNSRTSQGVIFKPEAPSRELGATLSVDGPMS